MPAVWFVAGVAGFLLAMAASRRAVHHASAIAFGSRIPPFFIGLTLLAVGTDLPEIANSVISSLTGHGDLNVSDSIGSSATQLTLVLGLLPFAGGAMVVGRARVRLVGGLTVLALAAGLWLLHDGRLTGLEGGSLVAFWIVASVIAHQHSPSVAEPVLPVPVMHRARHAARALAALALVGLGAWLAVEALVRLAELVDAPLYVIGFLGAALGTSLPEMIVDITAVRRGQRDLAVGDAFGSSLVDATLSIGVGPIFAANEVTSSLALRGGLGALAAIIAVTILLGWRPRHTKVTGVMLILLYAGLYLLLLSDL